MRRIKIVLVPAGLIAALAGVWLAFAWHHPPTVAPAASIRLIGYTNFSMSNPDTSVLVYPGRGSWLRAQMVLTNEGYVSISYAAWGDEPYGWAKVQTDQGTTNGYLAPHFTGGTALLKPGCSAAFWVVLPTNTLQWQCGFEIEAASIRERAIRGVLRSKFCRRVPEALFYPMRLLPDRTGPSIEVKTGTLQVADAGGWPHNNGVRQTRR
jgi:hypothetical protein